VKLRVGLSPQLPKCLAEDEVALLVSDVTRTRRVPGTVVHLKPARTRNRYRSELPVVIEAYLQLRELRALAIEPNNLAGTRA